MSAVTDTTAPSLPCRASPDVRLSGVGISRDVLVAHFSLLPSFPRTRETRGPAETSGRLGSLPFRRALRREATLAERHRWTILRAGRLGGLKVRRQHAIGPHVVDFYWAAARLAIGLDGSVYGDPARADADARRERALLARGVRTLRSTNADVLGQPGAVAAGALVAACPA